jgi:hypothetical protein
MSFVIISISTNTVFPILGTLAVSMSALERFTIVRVAQLRSVCSGRRLRAAAGGSTGLGQIVADESEHLEHHLC